MGIEAQQVTITEAKKRIRWLISQKDTLETRRNMLGDATVTEEEIVSVNGLPETENARLQEAQAEKNKLEQRFADPEGCKRKITQRCDIAQILPHNEYQECKRFTPFAAPGWPECRHSITFRLEDKICDHSFGLANILAGIFVMYD